jgi:hypothetical protein
MKIGKIDYDKSFLALFPKLLKKLKVIENPSFSTRFLVKIGAESQEMFLGIMQRLSQETKDEFLHFALSIYRDEWISKMKELLGNHPYGQNISFDTILLDRDTDGHLCIYVQDLIIDYKKMMGNEGVRQKAADMVDGYVENYIDESTLTHWIKRHTPKALDMAARFPPSIIESSLLSFLSKGNNKQKLIETLVSTMNANGIYAELLSTEFIKMGTDNLQCESIIFPSGQTIEMPEDLANALLDALSSYIKEIMGMRK